MNNLGARCLTTVAAFALCGVPAQGQQPPTDIELRSLYCARMIVLTLDLLKGNRANSSSPGGILLSNITANGKSNLARLEAYLLPRMQYLDVYALMAAKVRAEADFSAAMSGTEQCFTRCEQGLGTSTSELERGFACLRTCQDENPAASRMRVCQPVNWLPF